MGDSMYRLKDMLTDELDQYARKGELTAGSLDIVDKLSHALKSISTITAMEEGGYSGRSYERGGSYRNSRRDSRGRYTRDYSGTAEMTEQLREMMEEAPDQSTRQEIQRLINKLDRM